MVDEVKKEEVVDKKEEKKSIFAKAKDAILPDPEEQAAIISTFVRICLLYTSPSPRDRQKSRMPSSA